MIDGFADWSKALIAFAAIVGIIGSWWRWVRPFWRRWKWERRAKDEVLIGRPAVLDSITNKQLAPALPGIGARMDSLTDTVAKLVETHVRLDDHEERIKQLEAGAVERIVNRADSVAAWGAIQAAAESVPPADIEER
jgi:hypothetical protein